MSPVYERAYQHWDGEPTPVGTRWLNIAAEAFRAAVRSKWVWALITATVVHVAIRAGVLYFTGQVSPEAAGNAPEALRDQINFTSQFMADAMNFQARWVLMVLLALIAAPALSRDLQAGALQFYFSKPITRTSYAAGKLLPPFTLGMAVTALPGLILWLVGMAFTPASLRPDGAWVMPLEILAAGALVCLVASLIVVTLSGLVANTNLAAATWVAGVLVSAAAANLLNAFTGRTGTLLVDIFGSTGKVTETILGATGSSAPGSGAWLVVLGLGGAALLGLWWVLRQPEVGA